MSIRPSFDSYVTTEVPAGKRDLGCGVELLIHVESPGAAAMSSAPYQACTISALALSSAELV